MNPIFSNLLWLPTNKVDLAKLKSELTLTSYVYVGENKIVTLFEFNKDKSMVGVPRRWGIKNYKHLSIDYKLSFPEIIWPEFKWPPGWGYRINQRETIQSILDYYVYCDDYGALLEGSCGVGKSFLALKIASELKTSALILTHKGDLAEQWHKTASIGFLKENGDYTPPLWPGSKGGHIQQNKIEYRNCHYVTAMAQTIYSRSEYFPEDFWSSFGILILDEGHRYSAETFEYVLRKFNCKYRLGISATWRRSDGLESIWQYHVGGIQARIKAETLKGTYIQPKWNGNIPRSIYQRGDFFNIPAFITALSNDLEYNEWLSNSVVECVKKDRRIVLVSDRNNQLRLIAQKCENKLLGLNIKPDIGLYVGNSKDFKQSKETKDKAKNCQIVLTNFKMMAEGTDVPSLDTLILATPKSDIEQTVGRIQRPHKDKKKLLVIAPVYQNKWSIRIGDKQEKMLKKLGFTKQGEQ